MENCKTLINALYFKIYFLLVGFYLIPILLFSQTNNVNRDSLQAMIYYNESIQFQEQGLLDSSVHYARKAGVLFADHNLWSPWYDSHFEVFNGLYSQQKFEEAINYLQNSKKEVLLGTNNTYYVAKTNGWLGSIYDAMGDYDEALKFYLEEVNLLKEAGNPNGKYGSLNNLSKIYAMKGDYDQALIYLEQEEHNNLKIGNTPVLVDVYWNKGKAYWAKGDFEQAISSYELSKKYGLDEASFFSALGEIYRDKEEYEKAMTYSLKAVQGYAEFEYEDPELYQQIGSIYWQLKKYKASKFYYLKAIELFKALEDHSSRRQLGRAFIGLGDVYFETDQLDSALVSYQESLHEFVLSFKNKDILSNPSIEYLEPSYGLWVMEALIAKGNVFQKQFDKNGDQIKLDNAVTCYKLAFQVIDFLRHHQEGDNAKVDLINYAHPIFGKAIQASFRLYQLTKDESYLNQAFLFSQRSKAFLLASALKNINAREVGGVPEKLIQKEKLLRKARLKVNQKIVGLKNQKPTSTIKTSVDSLSAKAFEIERDLRSLLTKLEKDYPRYYQLKYEDKVASLNDIRSNILDDQTAMIDYFLAEEKIYVLVLTKSKASLFEVERTDVYHKAIKQFVFQIGNTSFAEEPDIAFKEFTSAANFLYNALVEPAINKAGASIKKLIIIPDGELSKLPFEALLTALPANEEPNYSMNNISYLLNDYIVTYHYAPQILVHQKENKQHLNASKLFIGFAPDFTNERDFSSVRSCSENELGKLLFNREEVRKIAAQIHGDVFLNEKATKESFKNNVKDFRIIHLATHACADTEDPLNHKVFFANAEYLTTMDLFNLEMQAEMVVLSACETGLGEIVKGEGVMSLARGFAYNGCPNVLMSLWSVPDRSSSEIMINFYDNIAKQTAIGASLRNAKITYLKNQKSMLHHPCYWAAFVTVGDSSAIETNDMHSIWIWILGISILSILILLKSIL